MFNMPKTVFLGVRLTEEDLERLNALCIKTGKSKSELVRKALELLELQESPENLDLALIRVFLARLLSFPMGAKARVVIKDAKR